MTTTTTDARTLVRAAVASDPTGDPSELARKVMANVESEEDYFQLVRSAVIREMRSYVEGIERSNFYPAPSVEETPAQRLRGGLNVAEQRRASLLDLTFYVNDEKGRVRWGDATAEDHNDRIEYLRRMRDGINMTIEQHKVALRVMNKHKARSLGAIKNVEAALANAGLKVSELEGNRT